MHRNDASSTTSDSDRHQRWSLTDTEFQDVKSRDMVFQRSVSVEQKTTTNGNNNNNNNSAGAGGLHHGSQSLELTQLPVRAPSLGDKYHRDMHRIADVDDSQHTSARTTVQEHTAPVDLTDSPCELPRRFMAVTSVADNAHERLPNAKEMRSVGERLTDGPVQTETLADRQRDIQQALHWIRHELRAMRQTDHSLTRQLTQLATLLQVATSRTDATSVLRPHDDVIITSQQQLERFLSSGQTPSAGATVLQLGAVDPVQQQSSAVLMTSLTASGRKRPSQSLARPRQWLARLSRND